MMVSIDKREPTRRRQSADERRTSIAEAAVQIAMTEGLHRITHRAIATALGVTHVLVIHFTPSIESIRAEALQRILSAELDSVREELARADSALNALRVLIRDYSRTGRENLAGVWLDGWSLGRTSTEMAAAVKELMDGWQELLTELLNRGVQEREFSLSDPEACAWEIVALLDGFNAHTLVSYGEIDQYRYRLAAPIESRLGLARGTLTEP